MNAALSLAAALSAAVAFGLAAVLQGLATRDTEPVVGVDPRLLLRLARRPTFAFAVALNLIGFTLHAVALQSLPLFLVQAVISSSVVVTAVLSVRVLSAPLSRGQWLAVVTVVAGLAMLAPTASSSDTVERGAGATVLLVAVLAIVTLLATFAGRLPATSAALALGLLGGVGFGVVAVADRLLPDLSPSVLLVSPDLYVLVVAGVTAFLLYSAAMQRGSVTTTTAALVITQTAVPALVGALLLGDRVRPGLAPLAVAGFLLALGGAVGLARFEAGAPVTRSGSPRCGSPRPDRAARTAGTAPSPGRGAGARSGRPCGSTRS